MAKFLDDLEKSTKALSENLKNYFQNKELEDKKAAFQEKLSKLSSKQVGSSYVPIMPEINVEDLPISTKPQSEVGIREVEPVGGASIADMMRSRTRNVGRTGSTGITIPSIEQTRFATPIMESSVVPLPAGKPVVTPKLETIPELRAESFAKEPIMAPRSRYEILSQILSDPESMTNQYAQKFIENQKLLTSMGDEELKRREVESEIEARLRPKLLVQNLDGSWEYTRTPSAQQTPLSLIEARTKADLRSPNWEVGVNNGKLEYINRDTGKWTGVAAPTPPSAQASAASANLPDIPLSVSGDDYLKELEKFDPNLSLLIKKLANYEIPASSFPTRMYGTGANKKLITQQEALGAALRANPTFDAKEYVAKQKYLADWTGGGLNRMRQKLGVVAKHFEEVKKTSDAMDKYLTDEGGIFTKGYNTIGAWIADNQGKPEVKSFLVSAERVADELAVLYKGGNASATDVGQEKERILNEIQSAPAQKGAYLDVTMQLLGGVISSMRDNYEYNMGKKAPINAIITPEIRKSLKRLQKMGVQFDMELFDPKTNGGEMTTGAQVMNREAFIKDFEDDQKRKPTDAEIEAAKNEGYWE